MNAKNKIHKLGLMLLMQGNMEVGSVYASCGNIKEYMCDWKHTSNHTYCINSMPFEDLWTIRINYSFNAHFNG